MRFRLSIKQWLFLIVGGSLGISSLIGKIEYDQKQMFYNNGLQAYEMANCNLAVSELGTFLAKTSADEMDDQVVQAKAIQTECSFLKATETQRNANHPALSLVGNLQFIQRYPKSPLAQPLQQDISNLFAHNAIPLLAQVPSCEKLEVITQHNLMSQSNQPTFYQACGQAFERSGQYPLAIQQYEQFLDQFPNHQLTEDVKQAYAQALYKEAQAKGAGTIPPPIQQGSTGDGTTVVEIRNDSPEKLRNVFGGPTPRVEELEPCPDCKRIYESPPKECPNQGPVGRYTVNPGQYRVVVKSISDSIVVPYTGDWPLAANTRYNNCFYIVRRNPVPEAIPSPSP
ncbi:hypothetical protein [Acaryochloris sp. IP29b_bin.137]|uniref:tetratricopeptide repeat protein n=1 Tax=Acaryochloris sp. IP29b_bin.137 TaxID=2969217 RepID=UPI0026234454|nr:hypothetical protein [Acaryochloris sp. IP29b_bin.137]